MSVLKIKKNEISVSALDSKLEPRHRWYHFKEGYSSDVVRAAMKDANVVKSNQVVADPFSGSGTTPLTAVSEGFKAQGLEVNPFLRDIGYAKSQNCCSKLFSKKVDAVIEASTTLIPSRLEEFSTFSEKAEQAQGRGKWLFNSPILQSFESGFSVVSKRKSVANFLVRMCLINAVMDVSNAAKDGKCLRYKKDWKQRNYSPADFLEAFEDRAKIVAEDLLESPLHSPNANIVLSDSRKKIFENKFDLVVTSPPYLNSFDYTDIYRPELFLGGYVNSNTDVQKLRMRTLRSHVQVKWKDPESTDFGEHYRDSLSQILLRQDQLWNKRIPLMIQAYFEDMTLVLRNLRKRAKDNSSVWLVVSTSAYLGAEIPVDLIIADIATENGWYLREVNVLRHLQRVAGQQWDALNCTSRKQGPYLRESLVILDANPRK